MHLQKGSGGNAFVPATQHVTVFSGEQLFKCFKYYSLSGS